MLRVEVVCYRMRIECLCVIGGRLGVFAVALLVLCSCYEFLKMCVFLIAFF